MTTRESILPGHRGWRLFRDDTGYYAERGCAETIGYCDDLDQVREEIDADFEAERDGAEIPYDTPALERPWWETER